jgi:beta-lactamase regulating signal transducer with metallopeptidase domain
MIQFCSDLVDSLMRASLILSISAIVVIVLLRWCQMTSLRIRRMAYFVVVLQGCLLFRIPVNISPLDVAAESEANASQAATSVSVDHRPALNRAVFDAFREIMVAASDRSPGYIPPRASMELWAGVFFVAWIVGIAGILAGVFLNTLQFRRRFQSTADPLEAWKNEWTCLLRQSNENRSVTLRVTPDTGPLLCWQPGGYQLLVPKTLWTELNVQQRMLILQHELAHLQRGDLWKSLVIHLMALVQWFNPLAWLMVRRFDREAEWACDESVRQASPEQLPDYARTLLRLGSMPGSAVLMTQAAGGHGLADRIRRLLVSNPRKDSNMKKLAIVTLVFGFAAVPLLQIRARAEESSAAAAAVTKVSETKVTAGDSPSGDTNGTSQAAADSGTEAVLDLELLFDGLDEFRDQKAEIVLQAKIQQAAFEGGVRRLEEKLKDSPNDEEKQKNHEDEVMKRSIEMRSQLAQKESALYAAICRKITAEIPKYASEKGITTVRRKATAFGPAHPGFFLSGNGTSNDQKVVVGGTAANGQAGGLIESGTFVINKTPPPPRMVQAPTLQELGKALNTQKIVFVDVPNLTTVMHVSRGVVLMKEQFQRDDSLQILDQEILYGPSAPVRDITPDLIKRLNSQYHQ